MAGLINFEDENEVKQFLDNLGVEYSFQCYKEKDPEGKNPCSVLLKASSWKYGCVNSVRYLCLAILSCPFFCYVFSRVPKASRLLGRGEEKL